MIKILEEGPDFTKWPNSSVTIRIKARAATKHMDENGIKTVWVKPTLNAYTTIPREPPCQLADEDAERQLKKHPPGTLIDLQTGQVLQSSPQARQKLIDAVSKALEKDGKESSKNNPV